LMSHFAISSFRTPPVDWRGGSYHGTVTGKNINVWKRGPGGELLLFRQMTVHD